jgi:hypothetical protein
MASALNAERKALGEHFGKPARTDASLRLIYPV